MTINVMSFNILFGAGVDRRYDNLLVPELRNKSRVPGLVSFLNGVKPDILAIQEANGWNRGDPAVVEQIAEQLEMNYFLAEAPNEFHVMLFSKFKITTAENLSGKKGDATFETMRALKATLLMPDGGSLQVFVIHLDPFSTPIRLGQVAALMDHLEPYKTQTTILLGDMNFCVGWPEYKIVERAGWRYVAVATDIDMIWISPSANWASRPLLVLGNYARDLQGLSDHQPVGAEISIYPAGTPVSRPYPYAEQYKPGPDC